MIEEARQYARVPEPKENFIFQLAAESVGKYQELESYLRAQGEILSDDIYKLRGKKNNYYVSIH